MGSEYTPAELPVKPPKAFQSADHESAGLTAPQGNWWSVFNDPAIDGLVMRVLKNNLDIRKAAAAVLEVRAQFRQAEAERWPSLNVEASAAKSRTYSVSTATGETAPNTINTYSLSLPATFELDLWGRLARAEDDLKAQLLAKEENRRVIAQTVVADAVSLYLRVVSLERQIEAVEESINGFQDNLELVMRRYNKGIISILDVRQARRALAQAQAGLPLLDQQLADSQQQLEVLAGSYPLTQPARTVDENYYKKLRPVPPGLPSDLLSKRPDIRKAEADLRSLHAQAGVAYANRFPKISLTAELGYGSEALRNLFKKQSKFWEIAAGIVQPVFDYGKLKASQRAAQARLAYGQIEYARTVLNAFAEVENSLMTRSKQLQRRQRFLLFLDEARATERTARQRYERGLVDYLTVLDAQQVRVQAELDLIDAEQTIYQNRVDLHRALGGSWEDVQNEPKGEHQAPLEINNSVG
ncbi:MAG: efflux transporter outer membrane subunit [Desulfobacteraceae bacterium]|nr:efflux transporter outer membrane subunit [Desulfobacteraceae bacterium]